MNPTSNTPEQWLPVVGYEESYAVSDHGRVRSIDRTVTDKLGRTSRRKGTMLKPGHKEDGRKYVILQRAGQSTAYRHVHILVLEAFTGPRPRGLVGCHNDSNAANNHISNLRWDTPSSNVIDAVDAGTHSKTSKTHCPQGHPLDGPNLHPGQLKNYSRRACLACARAHGYIEGRDRYKPIHGELADLYYDAIRTGKPVDSNARKNLKKQCD